MHYLFRVLCFEHRVVSVDYFLDKLTQWEAADIAQNIQFVDINQRELDRYKLYVLIQSNSKKKISINDVMSLPWDTKPKEYDEEEDKKLDEYDNSILEMLNSGRLILDKRNDDEARQLFRKTPN